MKHRICRVTDVQWIRDYLLRVQFDDGVTREIDLQPVLAGEVLGALRDPSLFRQVRIDPEVHTLVWPNGADFDPATLHDWPEYAEAFAARARQIEHAVGTPH